jgi:aminomethyltransferase
MEKVLGHNLSLEYYHFSKDYLSGIDVIISRTGYTGELGYEIYFKGNVSDSEKIWNLLFAAGEEFDIKPVGLAARDSLRLEMGFCLYGNDIDKTTNPIEAGLGWITKFDKGDFIGRDVLQKVKESGAGRKLMGLVSEEKFFPRKDYAIHANGSRIGFVTSGTVSPVLEKPIALGYVLKEYSSAGTKVNISVRNNEFTALVVKPPFIKK